MHARYSGTSTTRDCSAGLESGGCCGSLSRGTAAAPGSRPAKRSRVVSRKRKQLSTNVVDLATPVSSPCPFSPFSQNPSQADRSENNTSPSTASSSSSNPNNISTPGDGPLGFSNAGGSLPTPPAPRGQGLLEAPFTGDFKGFSWNSQALLARDPNKQLKKRYRAQYLIKSHGFGILSETHNVKGRDKALFIPADVEARWCHGSTRQGGVGIWVSKIFWDQFSTHRWEDLEEGRVSVLRLDGPQGSMDIFCVYLDTASSTNRQNSI